MFLRKKGYPCGEDIERIKGARGAFFSVVWANDSSEKGHIGILIGSAGFRAYPGGNKQSLCHARS